MKRTSLIALTMGLFVSALSAQNKPLHKQNPAHQITYQAHRADWAKLKAGGAIKRFASKPTASRITRDASGRVIKVLEPDTHGYPTLETDLAYDTNGKVIKIVPARRTGDAPRVRTFTYDAQSRVISTTSPEAGAVTYTYDANSNIATKTDARI